MPTVLESPGQSRISAFCPGKGPGGHANCPGISSFDDPHLVTVSSAHAAGIYKPRRQAARSFPLYRPCASRYLAREWGTTKYVRARAYTQRSHRYIRDLGVASDPGILLSKVGNYDYVVSPDEEKRSGLRAA